MCLFETNVKYVHEFFFGLAEKLSAHVEVSYEQLEALLFSQRVEKLEGKSVKAIGTRLNILACVRKCIHRISGKMNIDHVRKSILDGFDLLATNKEGESAVHLSARESKYDVIVALADAKVDLNTLNKVGKSPLEVASEPFCAEVLRMLGADGWTPLMLSATRGLDHLHKFLSYCEAVRCHRSKSFFPSWLVDYVNNKIHEVYSGWTWVSFDRSITAYDNGRRILKGNSTPEFSGAVGSYCFDSGIHHWAISVENVQSMWLGLARGVNLTSALSCSPETCSCDYLLAFGSKGEEAVVISNGQGHRPSFDSARRVSFASGQIIEFVLDMDNHTLEIIIDGMKKLSARDIDDHGLSPYICMGAESESVCLLYYSKMIPKGMCKMDDIAFYEHTAAYNNGIWSRDIDLALSDFQPAKRAVHDFPAEEVLALESYLRDKGFAPGPELPIGAMAIRWNVLWAVRNLAVESICGTLNSEGSPMKSDANGDGEGSTEILFCGRSFGQSEKVEGFKVGDLVEGLYKNNKWYRAKLSSMNNNGTFVLDWEDGDNQDRVKAVHQIRYRTVQTKKIQMVCSAEGQQCGHCKFSQMYPNRALASEKTSDYYLKIWGLTAEAVNNSIESGLIVNARNRLNQSALFLASLKGRNEVLYALVNANADVNILDKDSRSPLQVAAEKHCTQSLKMMGADGWTALMVAAEKGIEKVDEYFRLREIIHALHMRLDFPKHFEESVEIHTRTQFRSWKWSLAKENDSDISFKNNGLLVERTGDTSEYSIVLGTSAFHGGLHRWSFQVNNVQKMWIGISRAIAESTAQVEGEYLLAFSSDGSEPSVEGRPPIFKNLAAETDDCKSDKISAQGSDQDSVNSGSEVQSENANENDMEEEDEDDENLEQDDDDMNSEVQSAYGIRFCSGQIIALELNGTDHTLKIWIDDILKANLENIDDRFVRPYLRMHYEESATLLHASDVTVQGKISDVLSQEDKAKGFNNKFWSHSMDHELSQILITFPGRVVFLKNSGVTVAFYAFLSH